VSALEVLLLAEAVLLLAAAFFWGVSLVIAGKNPNPDDPLSIFWRTFWKVFLRRRVKFKVALATLEHDKAKQYQQMKQHGDVDGIKDLLREELDEHEVDDADIAKLLEADAEERAAMSMSGGTDATGSSAGIPGAGTIGARKAQLNVKVNPFSERDELVSMTREGATIHVIHGPEDGRSNKAVISILSAALGVKPYQVSLLKGHYRARKLVQIAGLDQEQLESKMPSLS
jgi:uncharacterized protein YggU (UPF0235/DUF167 family)